ncbi:MAG: sulfotransferase [Gallionellaceae bacterium]|nr:sulfotransferase [Gallionellaceae bacterium]
MLEKLLSQLNSDLQPSERLLAEQYTQAGSFEFPLILVMGPLRSGTTLFMQWLANTGLVAYPTNLLSRFYQAPIIGSKIQLLLTDPRFNFRDELGEFVQQAEYRSENGKTRGVLAPNEFWYFWRRFLAEPDRDVWTDEELRQTMDITTMKAELAGVMAAFHKPFAAKGMLFNYNIPFLDSVFDKVLFIQIKRDPVANIASVLEARKRQLGSESAWYSFKIPEYEKLKDLGAIEQAAGQVHYINRALETGLEKIADNRKLVVQYEDFCECPATVFGQLSALLGLQDMAYTGEERFVSTRTGDLQMSDMIAQALSHFEKTPA